MCAAICVVPCIPCGATHLVFLPVFSFSLFLYTMPFLLASNLSMMNSKMVKLHREEPP